MNIKEVAVIQDSLPGWGVVQFNQNGGVRLRKGPYTLERYQSGQWVCSVDHKNVSFSSSITYTPGQAIGEVQEEIIKRLAATGKLLGILTGVEL